LATEGSGEIVFILQITQKGAIIQVGITVLIHATYAPAALILRPGFKYKNQVIIKTLGGTANG
jgi:hypothetical protein